MLRSPCTLLILLFLLPQACRAQQTYNFALSIPLMLKADFISHSGENKNVFGATGIGMQVQVNGVDENTMAFIMAAGILFDSRTFPLEPGTRLTTNLALLSINPSVSIAGKWPGIRYNVGIGTLIRLGQGVDFASSTQSSGGIYTSVDSVDYKLTRYSRSVIPFISLGVTAGVSKHIKMQLSARPTLLGFYDKGATFSYLKNGTPQLINISYQPVYLGVSVFYYL